MSVPTNPGLGGLDRAGLAIDRLVSALHKGLMPKLDPGSAVRGPLAIGSYGADATIYAAPATASVAGAMTAADFAKLATLAHPVTRLSYAPVADLLNGAALTANTYADIHANQNFTVTSTAAFLHFAIRLSAVVTNATAILSIAARAVIDSGGATINLRLAGGISEINNYAGVAGGDFWLSGLAAGTHTIKVQIIASQNATAYCRASALPNYEFLEIQVIECAP